MVAKVIFIKNIYKVDFNIDIAYNCKVNKKKIKNKMKRFITSLLLLFALGVNAMHFTDVKSEKQKTEFSFQKTINSQIDFVSFSDYNLRFNQSVDFLKVTYFNLALKKVNQPEIPDLSLKWRIKQFNKLYNDNFTNEVFSINNGMRVKAPPRN